MNPIIKDFKTHLSTLNYSIGTIKQCELSTSQYFDYLKLKQINLYEVNTKIIKIYFDYLHHKPNQKRVGGLNPSYIKKHKQSLLLLYHYLNQSYPEQYKKVQFPPIKTKHQTKVKVLDKKEVERLFKACETNLIGQRNKAMLALYYGCGLRKQEGILLDTHDIDFNKSQLLIRKSKTHSQRLVSISSHTQKILEDYLYNTREKLIDENDFESAFLVNRTGNRLSGSSAVYHFQKLLKTAKLDNQASLHTLRHSIATHLLQSGMKLEYISLFLGHRSLDSTQIYVHLVEVGQ